MSVNKVKEYLKARDEYYKNALELIEKGELRKASELLWGAVAQSIKALAATRQIRIDTHAKFFDFMREVAKEIKDEELYKKFLFLRDLHRNFYEETIAPQDFEIYLKEATAFMKKIEKLIRRVGKYLF